MKCPICKGKGEIRIGTGNGFLSINFDRRKAILALKKAGATQKDIQTLMGFKSLSAVQNYFRKTKRKRRKVKPKTSRKKNVHR